VPKSEQIHFGSDGLKFGFMMMDAGISRFPEEYKDDWQHKTEGTSNLP
jgi:hypothetical protein